MGGGPGSNHRMLTELAALYCRAKWYLWPVAIEANGLEDRNYDVVAIQPKKPVGIIGIEVKATYNDFRSGIKKGQFNASQYITELYLAYDGSFDVRDLPKNVGILKIRQSPICLVHDLQNKPNACGSRCKKKKNIFYMVERPAISWWTNEEKYNIYNTHRNAWLWTIATSNATKLINIIEANATWEND